MMRVARSPLWLVTSLGIAWCAGGVRAQHVESGIGGVEVGPRNLWISTGYNHTFETDIDRGGHFDVNSFRASFRGTMPTVPQFRIGGLLGYEFNGYDFSNSSRFQWDEIHTVDFGPLVRWAVHDQWNVFGGALFRFSAEDEADWGDAFTGGGFGGFQYSPTNDLSLGLAFAVMSQIEDDAAVAPVPVVRWRFLDRWTLQTGVRELGGRSGLGIDLGWAMLDKLEIGTGFQYQRRRFRLDRRNRVGEDSSLPLYLRATWRPVEAIGLEGMLGVVFAGDLRVEDRDGDRIESEDYDPTPALGFRLTIAF